MGIIIVATVAVMSVALMLAAAAAGGPRDRMRSPRTPSVRERYAVDSSLRPVRAPRLVR